jgi:hypothetical protein
LANEAAALTAPGFSALLQAHALQAQAEVPRLAGADEKATDSLRTVLSIYEEQRASPPADRIRAALADPSVGRR